jgi:hypothetical protein
MYIYRTTIQNFLKFCKIYIHFGSPYQVDPQNLYIITAETLQEKYFTCKILDLSLNVYCN